MDSIFIAAAVIAVIGILVGLGLGLFEKKFKVEVDPLEMSIRELLPGSNCGGCGYPGCDACAKAIACGEAQTNQCPVGGSAVGEKIAALMGSEYVQKEHVVAFVKCNGKCSTTFLKSVYTGIMDCSKAANVPGGAGKGCQYGCLGYGNCTKVCPSDAIKIVDGVAVVNIEKCSACGACVKACPQHIVEIIPYSAAHMVACSSQDVGVKVRNVCQTGCLGCGLCVKNCPVNAIQLDGHVAKIDYSLCTGCGICAEKCPVKAIK